MPCCFYLRDDRRQSGVHDGRTARVQRGYPLLKTAGRCRSCTTSRYKVIQETFEALMSAISQAFVCGKSPLQLMFARFRAYGLFVCVHSKSSVDLAESLQSRYQKALLRKLLGILKSFATKAWGLNADDLVLGNLGFEP